MIKRSEQKLSNLRYKPSVVFALLCTMLSALIPAQAQNFNYSPYSGASNLMWMARSLAYPLNRYSGYQAPFYLANSLIWNGAYGAARAFSNHPKKNSSQSSQGQDSANQYGTQSNGNSGMPNLISDQSVYAKWGSPKRLLPQDQQIDPYSNSNQWVPVSPNAGGVVSDEAGNIPDDPFALPSGAATPFSTPQFSPAVKGLAPGIAQGNGALNNQNPPTHPQVTSEKQSGKSKNRRKKQSQSGYDQSSSLSADSVDSPLARGFIHLVNDNYGGDITKALSDLEMRRYAVSVGLTDSEQSLLPNLSSERAEILKQIFADTSQSCAARIHAARMLLKPGSQASVAGVQ